MDTAVNIRLVAGFLLIFWAGAVMADDRIRAWRVALFYVLAIAGILFVYTACP